MVRDVDDGLALDVQAWIVLVILKKALYLVIGTPVGWDVFGQCPVFAVRAYDCLAVMTNQYVFVGERLQIGTSASGPLNF